MARSNLKNITNYYSLIFYLYQFKTNNSKDSRKIQKYPTEMFREIVVYKLNLTLFLPCALAFVKFNSLRNLGCS